MESRKVAIVTINDDTNYGNRLQNFALQEVVRSLGWEPETLLNRTPAWDSALRARRMLDELRHDLPGLTGRVRTRLAERLGRGGPTTPAFMGERRSSIAEFARTHLDTSSQLYSELPADQWARRYACGIVGSDQVWNATYRRAQGIDFLDFLDEPRRIAYAASFGPRQVPGFLRSHYAAWLQGIPHLSVREAHGRQAVADLTGRDVPVVVDPTQLVDRAVWERLVADQPDVSAAPYAVRFFLGSPTPAQDAWVRRHAAAAGLDVVDLHALDDEAYAGVGPAGFVAAIARSEVLYTDSFHAGIFGLLHRRPIVVRERFPGDPRWRELVDQNGLVTRPAGVDGLRTVEEVDWDAVEARRDALRSDSLTFLREALDAAGAP